MSIMELIENAVKNYPDNDAMDTPGGVITYREFDEQLREFVHQLEKCTSPGEFVGIEADRKFGAIVAMIGALKIRRPFVFIDTRDSESSNAEKVASLGIKVIARHHASENRAYLTEIPAGWHLAASHQTLGLPSVEDEIGYAIHTSGSTGDPKCVLVRTDPLTSVIQYHMDRLSVGSQSRTLQFARLTFDGCITEILWTLTAGACLVVLDEAQLVPGTVLQNTLEKFRITHLKTTPFALTATETSSAMSLSHVINGGGACRPSVVQKWSEVAKFHNAYGTTETTVCNFLSGELMPGECTRSVPLGDIVGDCDYYIQGLAPADEQCSSEGIASRGELVITGESVAVGYFTAQGVQRFTDIEGRKIYHTGDIVERRGGQLYFVERLDRQVKVRGYRLDPGEIEIAVCEISSVMDTVVTVESHEGDKNFEPDALVCYYQGNVEPRAVRRHLEDVLASYKIPSVIKQIDAFPYTSNGKVDRDALQTIRLEVDCFDEKMSSAQQILHLARQLTGVDDAMLHDNFFDLGGDSASAVILINKIKELGWVDAGVRDVLRAENLKALADQLQERSV
ncbi:AMP-binding enzyme C-terminal domain-containing protein [Actinopolyspora lacussalsi subsp. righensis]|uniref:AMP-binding enzyme C-terminal domain-containing protein n=1 Tax=Actinopolyspora righensis TaxID=995060 RepID=A0A1I6XGV1_9ACTN|nr:non-ribosomal peptide synthetase [Actinopolyspora righensis]SFT37242.1 AMP-binding enzyme C-terminal domain-containing protein [Actinopolyspora righensis]